MTPAPSVVEFYNGKNVLITGVTGFIGKALLEKLLRSCPGIGTIYLLLRTKKGVSEEKRLETLCGNTIFDYLHESQPDVFKKVKLIAGDILEENLGISDNDKQELKRNCNIVFHSAASVRFDQKLKDAVYMNTKGTLQVLKLAEAMDNIMVFFHLSTAYSRCHLESLEEKLYPASHDPEKIIDLVDWLDDATLDHLEPKIISSEPNTYAYTKAITENLVAKFSSKFPIAIGRPSIVVASLKEPKPGWIDNINGPTGLIIGSGKGLIHSMLCEGSYHADCVPVDVIVNGCILIAHATALNKAKEVSIYNMTLSDVQKITWRYVIDTGKKYCNEYPPTVALWYTSGDIHNSWLIHQIVVLFTHLLPAYIIDALLFIFRQKPFLVNVQNRIRHGVKILKFYTLKEWYFINTNFLSLRQRISEEDDKIFFIDLSGVDIDEYLMNYIIGARLYICKEDPSNIPRARKIHKIRYWIHIITKIAFYSLLLWLLFSKFNIINVVGSMHNTLAIFTNSGNGNVDVSEL